MRIDLSIDVERSIVDSVTSGYLNECVLMALSCLSQGNPKGVGMHPGMTIEWSLTRDEDAFV
jgi:hypothetical protein